jgi:hypothetical protein
VGSVAQEEADRRQRSSIAFPYGDLEDAVEIAKGVFEVGGRTAGQDQLAAYLGHDSTRSGAFRTKLSTARTFGLVEVEKQQVELTALGRRITDASTEKAARVEAFMQVPLYKQLYEEHRGHRLPGASGLEGRMEQLGVASKQKKRARQVFQRSAEQAGLFSLGKDRLIIPTGLRLGEEGPDAAPEPEKEPVRRQTDPEEAVAGHHELIKGLFAMLPTEGEFSPLQQKRWLEAAKVNLALVYGGVGDQDPEHEGYNA